VDGRYVAYYRVSTSRQGKSGLGVEAQKAAVAEYLNSGSWTLLKEFTEVESGKHSDRPQLAAALKICRMTGATLLVAKLDRLSRNAAFLMTLRDANTRFVACDMPQANDLTIGIMALVAQQEREAISSRTKAALKAAKARGVKLGGWKGSQNRGDIALAHAARSKKAATFAADVRPMVIEMRDEGLSLRQAAARLTEMGVLTPRGGVWTASGAKRVLDSV
jgi:DNA invertase Pin-like site-specific DNA recombinase